MTVATISDEAIARLRSLERLDDSPFLRRKPIWLGCGEAQSRLALGDSDESANEKKGSDGGVGSKTRSGTSPLPVEQTLPPYMRAKARTLDRSRHRRRELPLLVTAPRAPSPDASITTTAAATQHRPPASQRASEGWGENGESVFGPVSKSTVIDIARSGRRSYPASTTKSKGVTIPPKADTEGGKIHAVSNIGQSGGGRQARATIVANAHADNGDRGKALSSVAGEREGAVIDPCVDRTERLQKALAQVKIETATSLKRYRSPSGDSGVTNNAVPATWPCIISESRGSPCVGTDVFPGACDGAGSGHLSVASSRRS
ncbi:unnamed protein product [Ascophyllum nodosum]